MDCQVALKDVQIVAAAEDMDIRPFHLEGSLQVAGIEIGVLV